jgi:hypothetical protein
MIKLGGRKYGTASRENITFTFRRSRPNLPVSLMIDDGPFHSVLNSFTFVVPKQTGQKRKIVVMTVGEDNDTCELEITGETGVPDRDLLIVLDLPVSSRRYSFTVC